MRNSIKEMDIVTKISSESKNQNTFQKLKPNQSTGFLKELSLMSRTKDNVDHAGLSQPLVPLKVMNSSKPENLPPSQSKTSWTAQHLTEITAAKVV